jgi:HSP20 family molecular chaperone IbpA
VQDRDGFQIKADIPGVAKSDIKLDVDHNVITISAKRSSQKGTTPQKASAESDTDEEVRCMHARCCPCRSHGELFLA